MLACPWTELFYFVTKKYSSIYVRHKADKTDPVALTNMLASSTLRILLEKQLSET